MLLEYAAWIYLKIKEPLTPRPFDVPGGIWSASLITFPTVVICGFSVYYSDTEVLISGSATIALIILSGIGNEIFRYCQQRYTKTPVPEERQSLMSSIDSGIN